MDQDIVFKASVDDGKGGKSLASLRKEFQELNKELDKAEVGTAHYNQTLVKLGAVRDDIGDLRDTINALNPEGKVGAFVNVAGKLAGGFQAATGAAALFGVESEELEKTLLKVQAASAFAEGIKSIHGMSDAFKVLGVVIKANPIFAIVSILTAVTAAVIALTRETGKLEKEIAKETETISAQIRVIDRQLKIMEAQGATDVQLLELKRQKINLQIREIELSVKLQREQLKELANGASLIEQLTGIITMGNASNAMTNKRIADAAKAAEAVSKSEQDIADLKAELTIAEIKAEKSKQDEYKKTADKKAEEAQRAAEAQAYWDEFSRENDAIIAEAEATAAGEKSRAEQEAREAEALLAQQIFDDDLKRLEDDAEANKKARHEKLENEKHTAEQIAAARLQIESSSFRAAQGLSNLFFTNKLNQAKGNAQAELEIRKRQFQVEKAFSAVRATIDGYRAVTAALTIPPPAGPILAAVNAVAAAAQVASILATQFDGGNANYSQIQAPNVSVPNTPAPPDAPVVNRIDSTRLSEGGQNMSIQVKAEVVETESTERQKRVARLQGQATFG